ncbi:ABC transporter substrate-binding protein [Corynebacterium freneyi]|uniref:peptide ABC transporter substrate-binding protein n=1 Tax=Corynebacterium freneyi TaxID=134034 RepID=UPI00254C183F|nr:ABC transporter substrate-binding protein [Corynebacterium freneyi]MDK8767262.1 ABC transporter substrate-binding protein [Corynebacterium freneyi]
MKSQKKAILAGLTAIAASAAMVACSSDDGTGGGGDGSAVINAYGCEPQSPLLSTDTNEACGGNIIDVLYTGLVTYDVNGETNMAVAESIEANDDATEFTIKLRDDWTFTNGEAVTADSFIDAWNYAAASKNAQKQQYFFENIQGYDEVAEEGATADEMSGLEKVSDTEFIVKLTNPEASFPMRLGYSAYYPWPSVAFDDVEAYGQAPIGNGPYKLESDSAWQHNVGLNTVVNEDYAGDAPANGGVNFVFYQNLDTAYADLQSGRLDVMDTLPTSALSNYENDFPDSHDSKAKMVSQTFVIPENLEHFGDDEEGKLRRQAISLAFDRQLIVDTIYAGAADPAVDFGVPTLPGLQSPDSSDTIGYDPERAKELWAEADEINPWSGKFEIAYNADGDHQAWVEAVTNGIADTLDIEATGKAYPLFKGLRDDVTNKTINSAYRSGWQADYPSLANFLEPQYMTTGSSNDGGYSNEEFDRLLAEAAAETDETKANELYKQAQEILVDELPAIPMWVPRASYAWNPDVSGVDMLWNGTFDYAPMKKG